MTVFVYHNENQQYYKITIFTLVALFSGPLFNETFYNSHLPNATSSTMAIYWSKLMSSQDDFWWQTYIVC